MFSRRKEVIYIIPIRFMDLTHRMWANISSDERAEPRNHNRDRLCDLTRHLDLPDHAHEVGQKDRDRPGHAHAVHTAGNFWTNISHHQVPSKVVLKARSWPVLHSFNVLFPQLRGFRRILRDSCTIQLE